MRRVIVATLGLLLVALPASAQQAVPIHNHTMTAGPLSGAVSLLPARVRSLLGINNTSGTAVTCTWDDTNASATSGWTVPATTGSLLFDTKIPLGSLRCYAASVTTIQVMEGQ